jgi:hypothetical protein
VRGVLQFRVCGDERGSISSMARWIAAVSSVVQSHAASVTVTVSPPHRVLIAIDARVGCYRPRQRCAKLGAVMFWPTLAVVLAVMSTAEDGGWRALAYVAACIALIMLAWDESVSRRATSASRPRS